MTATLDPPKFERGTSSGRHPWFLQAGGPPILPPNTIVTSFSDDERPDKDHCPRCGNVKAAVCQCGYDWDNWCWVD